MINFFGKGWLLGLAALKEALFFPAVLPAIGLELAGEQEVKKVKVKAINAMKKADFKTGFIEKQHFDAVKLAILNKLQGNTFVDVYKVENKKKPYSNYSGSSSRKVCLLLQKIIGVDCAKPST